MEVKVWLRVSIAIGFISITPLCLSTAQAVTLDPIKVVKIDESGVDADKLISISVEQVDGREVPADWLPTPGASVILQVSRDHPNTLFLSLVPSTATSLAKSAERKTTNHPGICTNCPSDPALRKEEDFKLVGNELIATDYGGTAVIMVTDVSSNTQAAFVFPPDEDGDHIPDYWEEKLCKSKTCLKKEEDNDGEIKKGSRTINVPGDGLAAIDEYRGFMVSGQHIRTHPREKDLFVYMVRNECPSSSNSQQLGNSEFLANLNNLIGSIHILGSDPTSGSRRSSEWVDNYEQLVPSRETDIWEIRYRSGSDGTLTDRVVNLNAVELLKKVGSNDPIYQRGVRLIECFAALPSNCAKKDKQIDKGCYLGFSGLGIENANTVVYTQRIREYVEDRIAELKTVNTCKTLRVSTARRFNSKLPDNPQGRWEPAKIVTVEKIIDNAAQFYAAMEIGHALGLTLTEQSDATTSYGHHNKPGTGDSLDFNFTVRRDETTQACTFYIPSYYSPKSHIDFRIKVQ